jgi:UDP-N-acetyl-D-glucosamine dehydrogenase
VALYSPAIDQVVPVSSTRAAELTKLLENIHRAVNIGLVNEMKIIADRMDIDIHEVIRAAATKPFGFTPYYPGPGLGGHCIPIDPFYLTWKARQYGLHTRFIELAGEINSDMPHWVIGKVTDALNQRGKLGDGQPRAGAGHRLQEGRRGHARVALGRTDGDPARQGRPRGRLFRPARAGFPRMREHRFDLKSVELTPQTIASYDVVLLATATALSTTS